MTPRQTQRGHGTATSDGAQLAAEFLADVDPAVRDQMADSVTLREFLDQADELTLSQRQLLVDQALVLLERNYVHLDLKTAMHAVDPLQRLRLLQLHLRRQRPDAIDSDLVFHNEMSKIFHSLRDLHTNYLLPRPYSGKVAYLPFMIEEYFDDGGRHYIVSHVVEGFSRPPFGVGVEVTHWNGTPIDRAVAVNADRFAGSNPAARHARGLESLTIRPLIIHLPPDEEWVTITYRTDGGGVHTLHHDWLIVDNLPPFIDADEVSATAATLGLDIDADEAGRAKTLLFAPAVAETLRQEHTTAADGTPAAPGEELATNMPTVFRARAAETSSGVFGHIRIFTFNVDDPAAFVTEFVRLISLLPQDGLIVDVRGNGGGHIHASEFTLQTLTPRRIRPEPVQFASTDLNLAICRRHKDNPTGQIDLGAWFRSLDQATETGAEYSGAFPITPVEGANARGQHYHGPVVLITDARCYSATDIFAAGFADHEIGEVLGVDDNTGAGGANVWTHGLLTALLRFPNPDPDSPYVPLPRGANMRVSIRRTLRVGEDNTGTPVEDLGVVPSQRHRMSRRDVLAGNADLLDRAGAILAGQPVRRLEAIADVDDGALELDIDTVGVDRVDIHVDDRPRDSIDVTDGTTTHAIHDVPDAPRVRLDGYHTGALVASRTIDTAADGGGTDGGLPLAARVAHRSDTAAQADGGPEATIVYVHGAGNKPPREQLKRDWDSDLFQRDMGGRSVMAYYADVLHATPARIGADACAIDQAMEAVFAYAAERAAGDGAGEPEPLQAADLSAFARTDEGRAFAERLGAEFRDRATTRAHVREAETGLLPLPGFIEEIILRELLRRLVPDAEAYFFDERKRSRMRARLRTALKDVHGPAIVVSHSLGTVIAYDVLREPAFAARDMPLFVTLGSPLGYSEIQDRVRMPLQVPQPADRWTNVADRFDVVALDTGLNNDFNGGMRLIDLQVDNVSPNNHAACGYLRAPAVRTAVTTALAATLTP